METNSGFSTNALINSLRSIFDQSKDKFSCDAIQETMNIITDLEHEVHLLQTNYNGIMKQNDQITDINQNLQELFQRFSASTVINQLPPINEGAEGAINVSSESQTDSAVRNDAHDAHDAHDEVAAMAELISDLVVKKLSELDTNE